MTHRYLSKLSAEFVLAIVIIAGLALMSAYFIGAVYVYETSKTQVTQSVTTSSTNHRPSKCRQYYNTGTDEWIDCMGVGYVSARNE